MSEIRNKVIDIIADRLSRDKATITEQSNVVADLGADSLDIAEIMMDLEDAFGVKLEEDNELKTIGDIIKYIESKVAENACSPCRRDRPGRRGLQRPRRTVLLGRDALGPAARS